MSRGTRKQKLRDVFLNQPNHTKLISCFQESDNDQDCQPEEIKYTSLGRCGTRSRQHITNCRQIIDHPPACAIWSQFPPFSPSTRPTPPGNKLLNPLLSAHAVARIVTSTQYEIDLYNYMFTKLNVYEPVPLLLLHHTTY